MTLNEILADAKARSLFGNPVVEVPADKVMVDDKGRIFIELAIIVACIQGQQCP